MTFIKTNAVPTLIILIAAAVVILASWPLAQTEWAEEMRIEAAGEQVAEETPEDVPGGVMVYVAVLIKFAALTGIGAGLTMLVTRVIRLISWLVRPKPTPSESS